MKIIITILASIILLSWYIFSFEITEEDYNLINSFNNKLSQLHEKKWDEFISTLSNKLQIILESRSFSSKNFFILSSILNHSNSLLENTENHSENYNNTESWKDENYENENIEQTSNDDFEENSNEFKENSNLWEYLTPFEFYDLLRSWVLTKETDIYDSCLFYYDEIDKVAKENDFPTELIIATWRMETSCKMSNPSNRWWLFQIFAYDYEPWIVSKDQLISQVNDFINFSINKWNRQKNSNLFKDEDINIKYWKYSIEDIRIHGVLYNWIWKSTLEDNLFVNGNLNQWLDYKKDWLIVNMLKIIKLIYVD